MHTDAAARVIYGREKVEYDFMRKRSTGIYQTKMKIYVYFITICDFSSSAAYCRKVLEFVARMVSVMGRNQVCFVLSHGQATVESGVFYK